MIGAQHEEVVELAGPEFRPGVATQGQEMQEKTLRCLLFALHTLMAFLTQPHEGLRAGSLYRVGGWERREQPKGTTSKGMS